MDEETTLLNIKRKKQKQIFVMTDDEDFSKARLLSELEDRVRKIMSSHIGLDLSIKSLELFEKVYQVQPERFNFYKRFYYWSVIKRLIHQMRMNGDLFIIIRRNKVFVLKTATELKSLKIGVKNTIAGLKRYEEIAENWVRAEKWREYEKKTN